MEKLEREKGYFSFRESIENRKECCGIRKVVPLKRALSGLNAWMTGLRREQSVTRTEMQALEWDEGNGIAKVNPLIDWSEQQTWDYIKANNVPYNALHDQRLPQHRLRALHPRRQAGRGRPRRPLVVGEPGEQGVWPAPIEVRRREEL